MLEKQDLENLKGDIAYLKYEAQSLPQVIEFVPYSEKPLDGASILEIILTIDSIQAKILQALDDLKLNGTELQINDYSIFEDIELSKESVSELSITEAISSLLKTRSELFRLLEDKKSAFFEVQIQKGDSKISIFELLNGMVKQERSLLKKIADLVLTYQTDRQFQREIANKPKT